ncbi:MAG: MAE_28990/MAE_18760 family HEPN-like nuclease, partial [Desulfobacterium sp.]
SKLRKKILADCKSNIGINILHNGTSKDIAKELLKVSMSEKKIFSGNIDNDLIITTALEYGFSSRTDPNRTKHGEKLRSIKDYRNDLAHGNLTFSEVGRSYDLNQLREYKDETIAYVEKIIENIDYYLRNQRYLNNSNGQ